MNTIPRLFMDPSWQTIRSMSGGEIVELVMLGLMSVGLLAAGIYGVYIWLFPRKRAGDE
jgi:hypothetical protein